MAGTPVQLALRFPLRQNATLDNFVSDESDRLVSQLRHFLSNPQENFLYLWGPVGSGVTHLLHAACHEAEKGGEAAMYMPLDALLGAVAEALEGLEHYGLLCLDEVDAIAGDPEAEQALFHCFNRIRDLGGKLIVAGHQPVRGLGLQLPDLCSRLQWGMALHLPALSDDAKGRILRQHAEERGFSLPEDVLTYIMKRSERSLDQLMETLERLDRASLSAQRKLTVPFVKQTLGW